jgi:hypothetical protein
LGIRIERMNGSKQGQGSDRNGKNHPRQNRERISETSRGTDTSRSTLVRLPGELLQAQLAN